jgi:hypothetical protein
LDSLDSASHVSLAEQQPAHVEPLHAHAPPEHDDPEAQALHAAPDAPHCELDCEA